MSDDDDDDTVADDPHHQTHQLYYFTVGVAYYERSRTIPCGVKHVASDKATLTTKEALKIISNDPRGEVDYDIVTSLSPISKSQYDCLVQEEEEKRAKYARRRLEEAKNETFMTHMSDDAKGIMIGFMIVLFMFVFYMTGQFVDYVLRWLQK